MFIYLFIFILYYYILYMLSVIYDILISFIYLLKIISPALLGRMFVWEFKLPKDILQECLEGGEAQ